MAKYYGMMVRENRESEWSMEFGSFDRSDVTFEIECYAQGEYLKRDLKLVVFADCPTQTEVEYFTREFNGKA